MERSPFRRGRSAGTRTPGLLLPKQARYQLRNTPYYSAYFTEFSQKSQARGREYHWESRESLDFWPGCWYSKDTIDISRKPLSDGIYPRLISAAPETKGTGHGLALLARRRKALPSRFPGAFNRNPGRHVPCGRAFCRFRFWEAENI